MKYAFTTLACPAWSIEQVVEAATTLGYDGVELRLLDGAVIDPGADRAKVEQAVARYRAAGVEVCALDSSCTFNHADPGAREREVSDLLRWVDLAEDLQVPLVRVFGGHARPLWPTGPLPDPGVTDVTPGSDSRAERGIGLARGRDSGPGQLATRGRPVGQPSSLPGRRDASGCHRGAGSAHRARPCQ